jgi:5-methylcytosine-specific restriction enzyme subunit McrC
MRPIALREYGRLLVASSDATKQSISSSLADCLCNLSHVYGHEIFRFVNRHAISAQQYVGVAQFGTTSIEVLPKIAGDDDAVRLNLVRMLSVALDLEISQGEAAAVSNQNYGVLEILIKTFCDKLFREVHRGLVRRYEQQEENLTVLRGRLDITNQIRGNLVRPERLYCRYDELYEDNALNQIFKAAVRCLLKHSKSSKNQSRLSELLLIFEGAADIPIRALPWARVVFDRMSERYRPCFNLAKLFLTQQFPDVRHGGADGISLFFEMNVLFEAYIGRMMQRQLGARGYQVTLQGPRRYFTVDQRSETDAFMMKPDIVVSHTRQLRLIVDTKWKELSEQERRDGIAQADMYQMHAYAQCYGAAHVILLYPHHDNLSGLPGMRSSYRVKTHEVLNSGQATIISSATVDLSDLSTVPTQLQALFADI